MDELCSRGGTRCSRCHGSSTTWTTDITTLAFKSLGARSSSFAPHWLISNRHVQTLLGMRAGNLPESASQHARVPTFDADAVDVYFDRDLSSTGSAPIVLVAHGMEGNHRSPSVRRLRLGARAYGWNSVTFEHRSCGRVMNDGRRLYHCGETDDLASVVQWIVERWPGRPLFVAGYSLSGSQIIHYLGSGRHTIPKELEAAASVSPPFDLAVSAREINGALGGIYRRYFLRRLIPKALAKARQHPDSLDEATLRAIRSLRDFDEAVTAVLHGFSDADAYYRGGSCAPHLSRVRHPLLILASEDDPFSLASTLPRQSCARNPFIHAIFTRHGGHCGFVSGNLAAPQYWAEGQILRFFGG